MPKKSPTPSRLKAPSQFIWEERGGTIGPTPRCRVRSAGPCPSPAKAMQVLSHGSPPAETGRLLICRYSCRWLRLGCCLGRRLGHVRAAGGAPRICRRLVRNISQRFLVGAIGRLFGVNILLRLGRRSRRGLRRLLLLSIGGPRQRDDHRQSEQNSRHANAPAVSKTTDRMISSFAFGVKTCVEASGQRRFDGRKSRAQFGSTALVAWVDGRGLGERLVRQPCR